MSVNKGRIEAISDDEGQAGGVVPYRSSATALQVISNRADPDNVPVDRAGQFWSILQTLLRRRWLILAVLVLGVGASTTLTLLKTPLFRASATLEVQRQETQIIEGADVQPSTIADAEHMAT